jgi:Xaa-Pro aminopeptidase
LTPRARAGASASTPFALRRARILAALDGGGPHAYPAALLLPAAPELLVGADGELRYAPDPDLYYLTGCTEPEAVLVLAPGADEPYTLFMRPRDPERERWTGPRLDAGAARERYGANAVHPIDELVTRLPKLVAGASVLYAPFETGRAAVDGGVRHALAEARRGRPRSGRGIHTLADPRLLLGPMRVRKDAHEIGLLRHAAEITVAAFLDVAPVIGRAAGEWQVEAALEHAFRHAGADGPAFPTIAASGPNATVLHYVANAAPLRHGELLLIDAGARYRMYCGDISRTFPVGGRFTAEQRAVYDVVLRAHAVALAEVAPGAATDAMHQAALRTLVEGMIALGLLDGNVEDAIERRDYRRYYPHRTSHWIGLDVHDVGDYAAADGSPVELEPDMVLTIEPGLYIPADDDTAPAALRGIGVRLEDSVLVTRDGHENLTAALAIGPADVEALVGA